MTFWTSLLFLAFMATSSMASMGKQTYIIHMDRTKIGASDDTPGNDKPWYEFVTDSMSEILSEEQEGDASPLEILYTYETTISGFAVQLSIKQLESFKRLNGFLSAIPDEMLSLHTTHTPSFLGLEPGRGLWSATNLASDVIVGVVDTGIWPEHVSFEDSDMPQVPSRWKGICEEGTNFSPSSCNKKIIGARAFWKGYETLIGRINETADYRSPRDSNGHGTHTASTAAGNLVHRASLFGLAEGFATGMRFTSRVAAYKACWSLGCAHSDILAAIDRAVADGVDVLSLSLGGVPRPYYKDNVAIASFRAVQNGVFVTCSAGNSGPFSSTVENTAPWIMTVAASYTDRSFPTKVKLGNGRIFKGSSLYCGKRTKQLPLVYAGTAGGPGAQFCIGGSLTPKLVKGKIVACEQGINSRTEKGEQVKNAGGAGMLLLNTEDQGEELLADPHILPATSIGASAGKAITIYLNSTENPTASIVFKGTAYGNTAPVMAAFSSRGPGLVGQDVIKPDVTAPGVNILAAWSPMRGPSLLSSDKRSVLFNIISGTSMSCPHVSGVVALLKSVHKGWSPAAIKSALMTTAYTEDNTGAPLADISSNTSEPATAFAFGSGHVDPPSAVAPGLIYDIAPDDYLYYLCSLNYTSSQIALLSRGNFTCPRNSVLQPGDLNYPSFAVIFDKKAETENVTYKRTVTNVGNPWSSYMVEVEEPTGVSVSIEPRRLSFKNLGEKLSYKVRFTALPGTKTSSKFSFGSLLWISELHTVRSPIAVTWQ